MIRWLTHPLFHWHLGSRALQRCYRRGRARLITISHLRFHLIMILVKLPVCSTQSMKYWPLLISFEVMRYYIHFLNVIEHLSVLTIVSTLERKVMFTYRHIGKSICLLRISMGRDYVAPCIRHPPTSQTVNSIWAVSGYVLLPHITVLIVDSVS